jgi:hypothetical protein
VTDGGVEFLLPYLADQGIKRQANEEVDEQAGVHLKEAVLWEREMAGEQEVDEVAQEDG